MFKLLLLCFLYGFTLCFFTVNSAPCFHKGCDLSGGLSQTDLNSRIEERSNGTWSARQSGLLKVMQWNILYDKRKDANSWANRRTDACNYINAVKPDILTLQEVMLNQLNDLRNCLLDYQQYGKPREDSKTDRNPLYNPLFVRKTSGIDAVAHGTFWLSYTPDAIESRIPSSKEPRICSWVKLVLGRRGDKTPVFAATTHLAYRAERTAAEQIKILMTHMRRVVMSGRADLPLVVTGDFNWESNSTVYQVMVDSSMKNTMAGADESFPELSALPPYPGLIDYVWQHGFKSLLAATMTDARPNGRMLSDHRPVVAVIKIKN